MEPINETEIEDGILDEIAQYAESELARMVKEKYAPKPEAQNPNLEPVPGVEEEYTDEDLNAAMQGLE